MKNYYIDRFLKFENTYLDYPFPESEWAAIRHTGNKKYSLFYMKDTIISTSTSRMPPSGQHSGEKALVLYLRAII